MPRRRVDGWFWEQFVYVCGSKCGACGETGVRLERGHIIPYSKGGTDSLDNLIPLCAPCNKRYLKSETPDNRPKEWLVRFLLILWDRLGSRNQVPDGNRYAALIDRIKRFEIAELSNRQNNESCAHREVFPKSNTLTKDEAKALVEQLIDESRKLDPPPRIPNAKRKTDMAGLALQTDQNTFWQAGLAFLRDQAWIHGREIVFDSWQPFVDGFEHFVRKWQSVLAAEAERVRQDREQQEAKRQGRLTDFLSVLEIPPDWEGLSDGDRLWIEEVRSLQDSRNVDDAEVDRSRALNRRYGNYVCAVNAVKPSLLRDYLFKALDSMPSVWQETQEYVNIFYAVRNAKTLEKLLELTHEVEALFRKRHEQPEEPMVDESMCC